MPSCEEIIQSNEYMDLIIDYVVPEAYEAVLGSERCSIQVDEQYRIWYANRRNLPSINVSEYTYQYIPKLYAPIQNDFNTLNLSETGSLRVQRPPLSLTGSGTVIAIIDTGIDYRNAAFRNPDGSTRILAIWDQTLLQSDYPQFRAPIGIPYGVEFTREDINRSLRGEIPPLPTGDEIGHGTAVASVAAGSNIQNGLDFLGAAPNADIVVVKLKQAKPYLREYYLIREGAVAFAENDVMLGVKYAQSFRIPLARPVVICPGIGTNMGDHAGNVALDVYLDNSAAKRGQAIVIGGGNEGNAAHHFTELLSQTDSSQIPPYSDVEIRVGEGEQGFVLEMWGNAPNVFRASVVSPGGERIPDILLGQGQSVTYSFVYENTKITIDSIVVEQGSGDELVVFRFKDPTPGIWTIRVSVIGTPYQAAFHMWLPVTEFLSAETYFLNSSPYTTLTEPSLTPNVLTVSVYDGENGSFYVNSGRGYARDGRIKPDVATPGVEVPTIRGARTGASMAAALAAGAVAQFMEWAVVQGENPLVEGKEIKNYFIRGAQRDDYYSYPNREVGFGKLNVNGVFESLADI